MCNIVIQTVTYCTNSEIIINYIVQCYMVIQIYSTVSVSRLISESLKKIFSKLARTSKSPEFYSNKECVLPRLEGKGRSVAETENSRGATFPRRVSGKRGMNIARHDISVWSDTKGQDNWSSQVHRSSGGRRSTWNSFAF